MERGPDTLVSIKTGQLENERYDVLQGTFSSENRFSLSLVGRVTAPALPEPFLVDPAVPIPLDQAYSRAVRLGRKTVAGELLAAVIPGFRELEVLVEDDGKPALYMNREASSRPVGLEGDGVLALARLALELAAADEGVCLVEEPEVHQHPSVTFQSAKAILAGVRRGLQVIVSTHSLDLIDGLLAEATPEDLGRMATYRFQLREGVLASARYSGEEMVTARREIEDDLR